MRIVSMALNVPGPVAVSRLVAEGAHALKIEPPWGDPLASLCRPWYDDLHRGIPVETIDLKSAEGHARVLALLHDADVFVASHRPAALARLGLDARSLQASLPALRHVNIVGDTANPEEAGHDLTYQARAGLLPDQGGVKKQLPLTLIADMAGAERAHATIREVMQKPGTARQVGLFDALNDLAAPLRYGLTAAGGHLGGGPGTNSSITLLIVAIGRPGLVKVSLPSGRITDSFSPRIATCSCTSAGSSIMMNSEPVGATALTPPGPAPPAIRSNRSVSTLNSL